MATQLFQPDDRLLYTGTDGARVSGTVRSVDDRDVSIKFENFDYPMTYQIGTPGYARLSMVTSNPFDLAPLS